MQLCPRCNAFPDYACKQNQGCGGCGLYFENPLGDIKTLEECQQDICTLPMEIGRCRAAIPRYYFNGGECEEFTYGGCGGNGNRYLTESECLETCSTQGKSR